MSPVRTRFAPSPTGYLHIGGARTALFNYLFARHHGGAFILRIEDTDRERSTKESIQAILDALAWLRLEWDEGPFFQSQRSTVYTAQAERLLSAGKAYRCYCTPEELESRREAAMQAGRKPMYDRTCRERSEPVAGRPAVIRFAAPLDGDTVVPDLVKGHVVFQNQELDDIIIVRSDGTPTYNFCAVVDDAAMAVTHIVRGEDHLTNTPKQIQMYRALGFEVPAFAHIPLILGLDRSRLSKRHGATSVMAYRDMGYLPDALVNYLVRLGWSHGDQELFTRAELIEKFSLDSVGTAAGVYNQEKAEWVNFQYLKALSPEALAEAVKPHVTAKGWTIRGDDAWLARAMVTVQERGKTLVEIVEAATCYFVDELTMDPAAVTKHLKAEVREPLTALRAGLADLGAWSHDPIKGVFETVMAQFGLGLGKLAQPVRVAMTGGAVSPGIFEVLEVLGKDRTMARLDAALARLAAMQGHATG
ncbi:glutamate--tRNA ligase [Candidatus Binatia bacterium]|nr:glutamate--tRNA ligase [Candidatus Binatia bacterium]